MSYISDLTEKYAEQVDDQVDGIHGIFYDLPEHLVFGVDLKNGEVLHVAVEKSTGQIHAELFSLERRETRNTTATLEELLTHIRRATRQRNEGMFYRPAREALKRYIKQHKKPAA